MASLFINKRLTEKSKPSVQRPDPTTSVESAEIAIQGSYRSFVALQSLSISNPLTSNKKLESKLKHPQDEQPPKASSEGNVDLNPTETEGTREGGAAVCPVGLEDHDPSKQLLETVHTETVEEQQTDPASKTSWSPETYSQRLWDIAYDLLKNENPDVVGQYELNIIACNRATTDEFALGRLSDLIRSGSATFESPVSSRAALMEGFLARFLSGPVPRTPERPDSPSQQPDNTSGADKPIPEAIESLEARLKELVRGSQYASVPWVASILALEGFLRLLTKYEVNETESTIISVICKMQWYIGISRQLFRAGDQPPRGSEECDQDQALINLYKAILSHQIRASICAFDETNNRPSIYKDFGPSDLAHFEQNIKLQQETLETFKMDSFKSDIDAIISNAALQKNQDTESESDEEEGPAGSRKTFDELLQAIEVPKQPIMNLRDAKHCHFIKLYQWLQATAEFRKFASWDNELNDRVLRLDGDLDMGKAELLQLVCHGLSEPQEEDTSGSSQRKHLAWYFYDSNKSQQNNVLSAMNSLTCQVLRAQPFLDKHLETAYCELDADGSDGLTGFYTWSMIFYSILRDVKFQPTYFIIHILDGSSGSLLPSDQSVYKWGHEDFLGLIYTTAQVSDKVRWLVSSSGRHENPAVLDARPDLRITISYNTEAAREVIATYAASRLADIAKIKDSKDLQAMVLHKMRTFLAFEPLWFNTALDIVKLDETYWNAPKTFEKLMETATKEGALSSLYNMALERLDVLIKSDREYCQDILSVAAIAYRPLLSTEIRELIDLPSSVGLTVLIERFLSPFLKLCNDGASGKKRVHFVHQSARTFFLGTMFSTGPERSAISTEHSKTSTRCLKVLIRSLEGRGAASSPTENGTFNVYAALYWMRHISEVADLNAVVDSVELAEFFMRKYRVQWLEVVASHGKLRDTLSMIENMNLALSDSAKPYTKSRHYIPETIQDTGRFIKLHLLWTNDSLGNQLASDYELASPKDSLVFWPSMKPQWLVQAPTFEISNQTPEHCLQVLKHDDWVRTCIFSPDGRLLVTGSDDQLVRVWDADTGALQHVFEALDSYAYSVVTSRSGPDGRPLLAAYGSEAIMIWDLVTGELMEPVKGIRQDVKEPEPRASNKSVRFQNEHGDPHDDTDENQTVEEDRETIQGSVSMPDVSAFAVESIDISPQGDRLVALTGRNIIFWDIPTFTVTGIYEHEVSAGGDNEEDTEPFRKVKFSPDGRLIAASVGKSIRIQDVSTEDEHYSLPNRTSDLPGHSDNIDGLCFSPEGNGKMFLASGSDDGTACIWNLDTGEIEVVLKYHSSHVNSVSFSLDGTLLATASSDSNIAIWKQKSGSWGSGVQTNPNQVLSGHTSMIWSVAFAPHGHILASAGNDCEARISEVIVLERAEQPEADNETKVDIGEASDSARKGHSSPVACVSISPDGKTIASGRSDGQICFWNGVTGAWRRTMEDGHEGKVNSLVFSDDGETLVSTSVDDSAIVWSVNGGAKKPRLRLKGHGDWVRGAAISIGGNLAATASDDWNVLLWDISAHASLGSGHESTQARPVAKFSGHKDYVYSVAFSPDSRQLASAGDDSRVMLWDIAVHEDQEVPKTEMVEEDSGRYWRGVVFTPDSNFVLTVSVYGEVAIWKPEASQGNQCLGIYKAATPFTTMRIDKKRPNALFTDSGIWLFETKGLRRNQLQDGNSDQDPVLLTRPVDSCIGISPDNSRITWNGRKLILLPTDFRPNRDSSRWAQGRCAVIGCESGQVLLFRVSEDYNPLLTGPGEA